MAQQKEMDYDELNKTKGEILLKLIKEHKSTCTAPHCGVSLFLLKDVYEFLSGNQLAEEELKDFL